MEYHPHTIKLVCELPERLNDIADEIAAKYREAKFNTGVNCLYAIKAPLPYSRKESKG